MLLIAIQDIPGKFTLKKVGVLLAAFDNEELIFKKSYTLYLTKRKVYSVNITFLRQ